MDAIEILKAEHKGAKGLMEEIVKATGAKRKQLFEKLMGELETHDRIEEQVFYPAVAANPKATNLPGADKKAHEAVESILASLHTLPVEDKAWITQFTSMQKQLLAHVSDEESKYFVLIRSLLTAAELTALGEKMKAAKKQLVKVG
ncbi:MAG TPA: hemerythrin domain-containing protein [bacterium]|jgi:hemerythrin superfamily protein|nr:hemerythrin domain-containing protein [bacterium]